MRSRSSSANACGSILISTVVSVTGSVLPRPGSGVVRDVDVHFRGPATDDTVQVALLALGSLLELVAKGYPQIDAVDDDIQHLPLAVAVQRHAVDDGVDIAAAAEDRKSTRLNSSHVAISYAVFCLKKKKVM